MIFELIVVNCIQYDDKVIFEYFLYVEYMVYMRL